VRRTEVMDPGLHRELEQPVRLRERVIGNLEEARDFIAGLEAEARTKTRAYRPNNVDVRRGAGRQAFGRAHLLHDVHERPKGRGFDPVDKYWLDWTPR
jgi:hypothetical protein